MKKEIIRECTNESEYNEKLTNEQDINLIEFFEVLEELEML